MELDLTELERDTVETVLIAVESCSFIRDEALDYLFDEGDAHIACHEDFVLTLSGEQIKALRRAIRKI